MTNYTCSKCNKNFKQKSHFINHTINKKKPCNIETKTNLENNNFYNLTDKTTNITTENSPTNLFICSSTSIYKCEYCEKLFTRKDSLNKHIKISCKNKKTDEELDNLKVLLNNAFKEIEKIKMENELLKNCIPQITTTNSVDKMNNTVNNGVVNNNVVNNSSINSGNTINIVKFGKEDISKMDFLEAMNVFLQSTGGNIISNMLKHINFNPEHPENFNICMSDLAREIVKIYNGEKFVCKKFKTVKDQIIGIISKHINRLCDDYKKNINITKNYDVLKKININNISLRLINNLDIEDLIREEAKKEKLKKEHEKIKNIDDEIKDDIDKNICSTNKKEDNENEIEKELSEFQIQKIAHLENKRHGLQIITEDKLKDELYNNRTLVNKVN